MRRPTIRLRVLTAALAAGAMVALGAAVPGPARPAAAEPSTTAFEPRLETYDQSRPIAPGVTFREFDRYGPDGYNGTPNWLQGDSLTVDLTKGTKVDYLFPGRVAAGEPISTQANRVKAVAAVNGDFFDINNSNAALGVGIQSGKLIQSPDEDPRWRKSSAIFTPDGIGAIGEVFFEGTIKLPTQTVPLAGVNKPNLASGGIEVFTPLWGTYCRCRATQGAARATEVEVVGGLVSAIRTPPIAGEVPANGFVLVGEDAGADTLAALQVGDPISIDYQARTASGAQIQAAINGRQLLVVNGVAQNASAGDNVPQAPRTAIGFNREGTKMFLLTADGRQPAFSTGLGLDELAQMMIELGAYNALNLDGGGSTTMVAREPGSTTSVVENVPSDGAERNDPNGLALFAPQGSGKLKGLWVEPQLEAKGAAGSSRVGLARPERAFPGLVRTLRAAGYDETYGPALSSPKWRVEDGRHGTVSRDGVFRGLQPGEAEVEAYDRNVEGELDLTVLGQLARVETTTPQVAIVSAGQTATFGVVGLDKDGFSAPIEHPDIKLSYDASVAKITPTANGLFTATALKDNASTLVTVDVHGVKLNLPLTVGLAEVTVADFENASQWTFFGERATGTVSSAPGKIGNGLRLTYDFTQATETRTGGTRPPGDLVFPGQPREIRLWANSTGKGEWASLQVIDSQGTTLPAFRAGFLTGTGWQQLVFPVPAGVAYPVKLARIYNAETKPEAQYQGDVVIDELTAIVPPSIEVPSSAKVQDPVIVQDGTVGGASWKFAVMSDAQFVARNPDSDLVKNARRTLRELKAANPDFLIINGDLVDEASVADFQLAKRILDEELGGTLPYYYVPGNHEVMGAAIDNFRAAFGDTQRVFDHKGTRFITLDTSRINFRVSDWTQLPKLRAELERAAADSAVKNVVLAFHVPPDDPTLVKASELSDRKEAATIKQWLADFQKTSGKGAAFIGAHVGTFFASHTDGVPFFINGNSGKNPSTLPTDGGFTGWSMWGVSPDAGSSWLRTEVRPHVDTLAVAAPSTVRVHETDVVKATLTQGTRSVPVAYPVTADWSASPNVYVGSDPSEVKPYHVATFDPATGVFKARKAATITLNVNVNGVSAQSTIRLEQRAAG